MKKYHLNLDNLTIAEKETGWVICETNYIEMQLKKIICHFIQPQHTKQHFVENILLHNININLGAKIKIFFYICELKKLKIKNKDIYHDLLRYRNGFAHSDDSTTKVDVTFDKNRKCKDVDVYLTIDKITSSGKFDQIKRGKILQDFVSICEQIKKEIHSIISKTKIS